MSLENRMARLNSLRDWSLITGKGGGYKTRGGGQVKFYPYENGGGGGGRNSFSHAEGGAKRVCMW